jgi:hypothetical protein
VGRTVQIVINERGEHGHAPSLAAAVAVSLRSSPDPAQPIDDSGEP